MAKIKQRLLCGLVLLFAALPENAHAQPTAASFDALTDAVKPGQRVAVETADGQKTKGNVVEITERSITLLVRDKWGAAERRSFDKSTVTTIRRADRLWNGLLIGLGAGMLATEVFVRQNCGPRGYDDECAAIAASVGVLTFVPGGAVIGALIDKSIGNEYVYREGVMRWSIRITPQLAPTRTGVSLSVTF